MRLRCRYLVLAAMALLAAVGLFKSTLARDGVASTELFCPDGGDPNPNVVLCEDFEDSAFQSRWDIGSNRNTWTVSDFVQCADDNFGFHSRCAAWTNQLVFDDAWGFYGYDARRSFAPQSELYIRWYQYISKSYEWGRLEDKSLILHDGANTVAAYVATSRNQLPVVAQSGPGVPFVANYQDLDWNETGGQSTRVNRFQNQKHDITLQPATWYLFEWYVKLNTPGMSDGVTRLWIDDAMQPISAQTLRMEYKDMRWLKYSDIHKQFSVLRLTVYHQRCDDAPYNCPPKGPAVLNQSHRWDRVVVSRSPVGPLTEPLSRPPRGR